MTHKWGFWMICGVVAGVALFTACVGSAPHAQVEQPPVLEQVDLGMFGRCYLIHVRGCDYVVCRSVGSYGGVAMIHAADCANPLHKGTPQ